MRGLVQRVKWAKVNIDGHVNGEIEKGFLVLLGIETEDEKQDADWLATKIASLRIFSDAEGLMCLNINQVEGKVLVISQFTLHAKTKKGTRPSFIHAAKPDQAEPLYRYFVEQIGKEVQGGVETGEFGADMQVELCNDGPVTIWIDTKNKE